MNDNELTHLIIKYLRMNEIPAERAKSKAFYKRWWFWLIIIVLVIGAVGAADPESERVERRGDVATNNESTQESEAQVEEEEDPYRIGDTVRLRQAEITVNEVDYSRGGRFSGPSEGNIWVSLEVTIENTGSSDQYVTTLGQMFLRDAEGNSYQIATTDKTIENINNRLDGSILANSRRTGWVGFEAREGTEPYTFQYNGSMWGGGTILIELEE